MLLRNFRIRSNIEVMHEQASIAVETLPLEPVATSRARKVMAEYAVLPQALAADHMPAGLSQSCRIYGCLLDNARRRENTRSLCLGGELNSEMLSRISSSAHEAQLHEMLYRGPSDLGIDTSSIPAWAGAADSISCNILVIRLENKGNPLQGIQKEHRKIIAYAHNRHINRPQRVVTWRAA